MTAPLPKDIITTILDEDERWNERRKRHGESTAQLLKRCESSKLKIIADVDEELYYYFLPNICAAHCTSVMSFIKCRIKSF